MPDPSGPGRLRWLAARRCCLVPRGLRRNRRGMVTGKLRELARLRGQIAALEVDIAESMQGELAGLPARFGFADATSFLSAVASAVGGTQRARRKRTKITDAMRADVKRLVHEGRSGSQIARELGISLPSVQSIKKAYGLVRPWKRRP